MWMEKKAASVTDDMLIAEIDKIIGSVKNNTLPDIKQLFERELRMNMAESDVAARVVDYFVRFKKLITENGLSNCFDCDDGERQKCKLLVASLHPSALKDEIKQCVRYTHKPAATDTKVLFKLILERATEHDRQYHRAKKTKRDQSERGQAETKSAPPAKKQKSWGVKPTTQPVVAGSNKTRSAGKPKPAKTSSGPPAPCPKCKETHWLSDCTKASEAEKVELRKKLREAREKKRAHIKRLSQILPAPDRCVMLNGVFVLPYYPDSGSDYTVIGRSHWDQLSAMDPTVRAELLEEAIENQAFGSSWVSANRRAKLQVMIHTAAGPVEPMGLVDVLIMDVDDDEFIVGNDLLTSLGIDVGRQLEQLADRGDDETVGDPIELEADEMPVGMDSAEPSGDDDIFAAVERLVERAVANGFPQERVEQLRTIAHAYDVWRLELRGDPPANVPPLEIRLQDGARPSTCKPRKYPPHTRNFLHEFNERLVDLGLVYENPRSRWASPALPVKKSGDFTDLRQTVDYRARNAQTEVMAAVMPILSVVMENARGMNHFGLFDFLKGFWQLPLAELCQEFLSYMTDEKIFTPRRVPQGCSDAAIFFQKTMEECFASLLYKHLLIWIDDLLLYAADMDTYLEKLAEFFSLLNQFGLKLSIKKSSLYETEVKWCGRILNNQGVRHDPERINTLRAMPYPRTAAELQQFVCAANWMRESLDDFARQVAPLQQRLDLALSSTKRTRRAAASITLELDQNERRAFDTVKEMLATSATLDFPNDKTTTCLFTDASDVGWSLIITQVAEFDSKRPATEQQHRLIQCMSGTFSGSQLNWTVIEKEAFPIVMACDKLDYLLLRPKPFRMYCDHRNLIHVFAPHESLKKHVKGKLLRWAMKIMNFRYVVEHVPGPTNVWADMISRWAGNHVAAVSIKRIRTVRHDESTPEPARTSGFRPLDDEQFIWPTFTEIAAVQTKFTAPDGAVRREGVLTIDGRVWIPVEAVDLVQRLCIIAHCGPQGHRGKHAMTAHLRRIFLIEQLSTVVAKFLKQCLLCLHSHGGKIIPRPWSELIECNTRNGVLHFDFLFMGEGFGGSKYLLVLKDHATHYCELVVADTPDSNVVVEALLAWYSRFGIPPDWVSDQGSHFKNAVMAELSRRLRTQQTFTPAYCPWINGSVERINRDILQVIRTMILSYKVSHRDWVYLVPLVQASLNHTAVPSLGNHAPVELFTGLQCPSPLMEFYLPDKDGLQTIPSSAEIDGYLANLRDSIQAMHCEMSDQELKQRLLNQKRRRGENLVNFAEGDYVLRSRVDEKYGNKLLVTWTGPYRVVRADTHSFRIQHLVTGDEIDAHASRLKLYSDASLEVTDELLEHVAAQGIILAVDELKSHRWNPAIKDFEILVSWKGLQTIEDSFEPLSHLAREIRVLVSNYVKNADDQKLTEQWQKLTRETAELTVAAPPLQDTAVPITPVTTNLRAPQGKPARTRSQRPGSKQRRRQSARGPRTEAPQNANNETDVSNGSPVGARLNGFEVTESTTLGAVPVGPHATEAIPPGAPTIERDVTEAAPLGAPLASSEVTEDVPTNTTSPNQPAIDENCLEHTGSQFPPGRQTRSMTAAIQRRATTPANTGKQHNRSSRHSGGTRKSRANQGIAVRESP